MLKNIPLFVLLVHGIFILILITSPAFLLPKKPHKSLIVRQITPRAPIQTVSTEKKQYSAAPTPQIKKTPPAQPVAKKEPPTPPKPLPIKKTTAAPKKEPAITDKKISKNKPPTPSSATPERAKISDSLLKELEESIAKIDKKSDKQIVQQSHNTQSPIKLQIDHFDEDPPNHSHYTDTLVNHLHRHLSLPDHGEVKIQLSLRQDGTITRMVVLNAQSEKNKRYLETHLIRLKFPQFEQSHANQKECTFILTFCNEF